MSAFSQAWHLLKALPEQRGYMGTLPPAVLQMLERRRQEAGEEGLGDVMHMRRTMPAQYEGQGDNRRMVSPAREVEMPSEPGDMREMPGGEMEQFTPERLPKTNLRVNRDISPLQEKYPTMISHSPRGGNEMAGSGGTSMANVMGHELSPEESFYTPREARMAREGTEQAVGRMLTGGQRGGRMNMTGGGRSGLSLPLRGEKDGGPVSPDLRMRRSGAEKQKFGRARSAANLGNVEGVRTGGQLGGASSQFVDEPEDKPPTQQERIASILSGMPGLTDIQINTKPPKEKEEEPTKEMPLRTMSNRYRENLDRVRQGEKPNLDFSTEDDYANTLDMFQNPGSPESLAMRERLMQFARQQGSADGSTAQNAIDRAA